MGALDWTRSCLTVHHLILIKGGEGRDKVESYNSDLDHLLRAVRLTRQEHDEQGSEGEVKVEPDWYSSPWWRQIPVQTGQHSPGGVSGRPQATLGQDTCVHTTAPF